MLVMFWAFFSERKVLRKENNLIVGRTTILKKVSINKVLSFSILSTLPSVFKDTNLFIDGLVLAQRTFHS